MARRNGKLIQFRQPTKAAILASAGTDYAPGEPVWSSDTEEMFVGDGVNVPRPVSKQFSGMGTAPSGGLLLPWNLVTSQAGTPTSGYLALYPFDVGPTSLAIQALAAYVSTAQVGGTGTLTQACLYKDNGSGAGPLVTTAGLLASVAITATSTGGKTGVTSQTLLPGRYWGGLLYYAGTTAPTTVPAFIAASASNSIHCTTLTIQTNRFLLRTGLTSIPTDGGAFTPNTGSVEPLIGLQAA